MCHAVERRLSMSPELVLGEPLERDSAWSSRICPKGIRVQKDCRITSSKKHPMWSAVSGGFLVALVGETSIPTVVATCHSRPGFASQVGERLKEHEAWIDTCDIHGGSHRHTKKTKEEHAHLPGGQGCPSNSTKCRQQKERMNPRPVKSCGPARR